MKAGSMNRYEAAGSLDHDLSFFYLVFCFGIFVLGSNECFLAIPDSRGYIGRGKHWNWVIKEPFKWTKHQFACPQRSISQSDGVISINTLPITVINTG